ncbi:MAG: hypothetical protein AAF458_15455 [Pseudomonadota bacterium]
MKERTIRGESRIKASAARTQIESRLRENHRLMQQQALEPDAPDAQWMRSMLERCVANKRRVLSELDDALRAA